MAFDYTTSPVAIEQQSFIQIRELTDLAGLDRAQQQVAMRIVHSLGMPEIAQQVRFSSNACEAGRAALAADCPILCDVEMVKQGVTKRMINQLQIRPLLEGVRGQAAVDLPQLAATLSRFSLMADALSDVIAEVDVNPLIVKADGCIAVDALVLGKRAS